MDPVTHGLTGALIAEAGFTQRLGNRARWLLPGVAMFPDIDIIYRIGGLPTYLENHRGLTHSFIGILAFGALIGSVIARFDEERRYISWISASCVALFSHQVLDLITSYGTVALYPFSRTRFYLDWVFIIDLFLTGIILLSLIFSRHRKSDRAARVGLVIASAYIGFCVVNHEVALIQIKNTLAQNGISYKTIAAVPQPGQALRWSGIIDTGPHYYQITFNNYRTPSPNFDPYKKSTGSIWEQRARNTELAQLYYWFARYPVVEEYVQNRSHIVEFSDLRFYITVQKSLRVRKPFVLRFVLDEAGNIKESRFLRS
jgi:inner membrane protein